MRAMRGLMSLKLWVLILPIAVVGMFLRVYYTPDEPREASMVVAMAHQADWSLPELNQQPFSEKPPLLYWAGGSMVKVFGSSEIATRVPNIVYWLITALAVVSIASRAGGELAGFVSGFVAVTLLQSYLALIWLATDAPLVAGVALALAGLYRGFVAEESLIRRDGFIWFYVGLLLAFFAKGPAGWLVPGAAFIGLLISERRFKLLRSKELWVGLPVLVVPILLWLAWVCLRQDGLMQLKIMFWYNIAGRFMDVSAPEAYHYSEGHQNSAFKYFIELPLYVLPWLGWALGSIRLMWQEFAAKTAEGIAIRCVLSIYAIALLLLSIAHTARGVYFAPLLPIWAVAMGLYVERSQAVSDRLDRLFWLINAWCISLMGLLLGFITLLGAFAPHTDHLGFAGVVALVGVVLVMYLALAKPEVNAASAARQLLAVAVMYTLVAGPLYLCFNRWLSLDTLSLKVLEVNGTAPLEVWQADETTEAMALLYLPHARVRSDSKQGHDAFPSSALASSGTTGAKATAVIERASSGSFDYRFNAHSMDAQKPAAGANVLVLDKDSAHWNLARWMAFLGYSDSGAPNRSVSGTTVSGTAVNVEAATAVTGLEDYRLACRFERAGGRTLSLWVPNYNTRDVDKRCQGLGGLFKTNGG